MSNISSLITRRKFNCLGLVAAGLSMAIAINSCGTTKSSAGQYEAIAKATYTWRVRYSIAPTDDKRGHYKDFESTSLTTVNGQEPEGAVMKDNNKDVWWPKLPRELPNAESKITASASYPLTSIVVDFLRPLLLCLTVWR